jgi:hypothetical protein
VEIATLAFLILSPSCKDLERKRKRKRKRKREREKETAKVVIGENSI